MRPACLLLVLLERLYTGMSEASRSRTLISHVEASHTHASVRTEASYRVVPLLSAAWNHLFKSLASHTALRELPDVSATLKESSREGDPGLTPVQKDVRAHAKVMQV